jgi:hypothetical protein
LSRAESIGLHRAVSIRAQGGLHNWVHIRSLY